MNCILNPFVVYNEASFWLVLICWTTESLIISLRLSYVGEAKIQRDLVNGVISRSVKMWVLMPCRVVRDRSHSSRMLQKSRGETPHSSKETVTALVWWTNGQNTWFTMAERLSNLHRQFSDVCCRYIAWSFVKPVAHKKWLQGIIFKSADTII